ncbi:sugar O-acetyltransferase [Shewanella gelidii]|nr:sugar O-acetyltransferase [Shewanella gelidii]MCL1096834.1 sugar O-acetyltransferase [Shewanella gelidii]
MNALDHYQKMLASLEYNCLDPQIQTIWRKQQQLNRLANQSADDDVDPELLPHKSASALIMKPFTISYGLHVYIGERAFINTNSTLQDNAPIHIGEETMIGPNVQMYTANHSLIPSERVAGIEIAKPITIGKRVWIGGGAIILPGVSIGDEAVIGAGAVVTKNVSSKTVVGGNPAKVIKHLD